MSRRVLSCCEVLATLSKASVQTLVSCTHTTISRVQGNKLKAKREIRVACLFKQVPEEF